VLDLMEHGDLIEIARADARSILNGDPRLASERGAHVRRIRDLLAPRIASLVQED
jgi:hypothetical protein